MKIKSGKLYDDNGVELDESPIFVLPCCKEKDENTQFRYRYNSEYEKIKFYATGRPNPPPGVRYCTPFGNAPDGRLWRDVVRTTEDQGTPAYRLYLGGSRNGITIYQDAYNRLRDRLFFLSSGWGILPAAKKMPIYYITFPNAGNNPPYMVRGKDWPGRDWTLRDFNIRDNGHYIILVAGPWEYHKMFDICTAGFQKRCVVAKKNPGLNGVDFINGVDYLDNPNQRTNWHYTAFRNMLGI